MSYLHRDWRAEFRAMELYDLMNVIMIAEEIAREKQAKANKMMNHNNIQLNPAGGPSL